MAAEGGGQICELCYERDYFTCGCCENVYHNDAYGSDGRCQSCAEEHDDEGDDGLLPYDYDPPTFIFRGVGYASINPEPGAVYFGLEIEVEYPSGWSRDDAGHTLSQIRANTDLWYIKHDGSLDNGCEFVSHPCTLDFWRSYPFPWAALLREKRFRAWDAKTCGLHIHVSRSALSGTGWYRLARLFRDSPALVRRLSHRDLNRYCNLDTSADHYTLINKAFRRPARDYNRYEALNFEPRDTVEFRIFRSTTNIDRIKNYLEAVNSLLLYCSRPLTPAQITERAYLSWLETSPVPSSSKPTLLNWLNPRSTTLSTE